MAVREELVSSAITFLQDPSVANAPLDKRVAFLQAKNLTQEEIDVALSRAGETGVIPREFPTQSGYGHQQQPWQQQSPQSYGSYQGNFWQQPPPEVPRRDWRDYFIMATVVSGLGYGIYTIAKRYVVPLIAPPTPPQLEQDKASIDEAFSRAFNLIEQLSADTTSIKASEEARKERLDAALVEVEMAVQEMRTSSRRRDEDTRRIGDEVRALQNMIPKAMKAQEESSDTRLKELNTEMKSLKTLIANRMSGTPAAPTGPTPAANGVNMFGPQGTANTGSDFPAATETGTTTGVTPQDAATISSTGTSSSWSSYGRLPAGRGGIPAWQMAAAAKKTEPEKQAKSESGIAVDVDGTSNTAA